MSDRGDIAGVLLDENLPRSLRSAIIRRRLGLQVQAIGDGIAPALGTLDPDILVWIEEHNLVLITNNRESMPNHLGDHLNAGRHVAGIFQIPATYRMTALVDEIVLRIVASLPPELEDRITYLQPEP